jgi:hypothetical protein
MSSETRTAAGIDVKAGAGSWQAGAVGGIVGAAVMGAVMIAMGAASPPAPNPLGGAIPGMYTLTPPNPAAGLFIHLSHGAVLGVVFAGVVGALGFDSTGKIVGAGFGWGVVTWILLAALVMPLWLNAVGFPNAPGFPNFAPPSLLWHLVYGLVLGGVYAGVKDSL